MPVVSTGTLLTLPTGSTVRMFPNGRFVYTPATGFNSTDTFKYKAGNGTFSLSPLTHMNQAWPANTLTLDDATVNIAVGGGKGGKK